MFSNWSIAIKGSVFVSDHLGLPYAVTRHGSFYDCDLLSEVECSIALAYYLTAKDFSCMCALIIADRHLELPGFLLRASVEFNQWPVCLIQVCPG